MHAWAQTLLFLLLKVRAYFLLLHIVILLRCKVFRCASGKILRRQLVHVAVADLMIHSGASELAHAIAGSQNTAYVPDIRMPGLREWIESSGLTARECAMIQPTYEPPPKCSKEHRRKRSRKRALDLPSGGGEEDVDENPIDTVYFIGTLIEGDTFLFCLDRSGSMAT